MALCLGGRLQEAYRIAYGGQRLFKTKTIRGTGPEMVAR